MSNFKIEGGPLPPVPMPMLCPTNRVNLYGFCLFTSITDFFENYA